MKKSQKLITIAFSILILVGLAQSAGAQEWKILTDDPGPGIGSLKAFLETTLGGAEGDSEVKRPRKPIKVRPHSTDRELLRLNSDQNREYAREGSWAPLETKPGEENFHLFTF